VLELRRTAPDRLEVEGTVDLATVGHLRTELLAAVDRAVTEGIAVLVVDLAGVDLVDATGLGVLLAAHRRARRGGCTLRLVRPSTQVARMLLMSRMYRVLSVERPVVHLDRPNPDRPSPDRVVDLTDAATGAVPSPRGASAGSARTV
jgi:anti-anti-sigma factor